ncbi:ABC transporter permease [Pseudoclavibacter terrae]|uniref:Molybdenum transport system permease n=1 Tax=Pseudoclavibacter terrae TaxID=1530195 RepID=A0A7J5B272_9MICO|nr:ABC transporter permease [Pseudoclavibacter terrae]KAB1638061.1 molybdate ABC transporter permease subunit [Pseudoclavibacter terrae]
MTGVSRRPPAALSPLALVALALLVLPILALVLRVPWAELPEIIGKPAVGQALWLSLSCAVAATGVCLVIGVPLAWWLASLAQAPGQRLYRAVRVLVLVPLVLPPVVGGLALLLLFGRAGVLGAPIAQLTGFSLPFTSAAVVVAQTFVALPFLVIAVEGALLGSDRRVEEAAATLGATRWFTFSRVTLPMVGPAIGAGAVLAFARALGEFGATITLAGSLPGVTRTMPISTYLAMQSDPDAAIALALLLLLVSIGVLLALRGRWVSGVTGAAPAPDAGASSGRLVSERAR